MSSEVDFAEGTIVEVHSLRSAPLHNGQRGELLRLDAQSGRWEVRLTSTGKVLALKRDNLRPIAEPTAGTSVEIHSLRSAPQYNGQRGELLRLDANSGRWDVRLTSTGKILALKRDNWTQLVEEPEPSSDDEMEMHGYSQKKIGRFYQEIAAIVASNKPIPSKICLDPSAVVRKGKFGGMLLFDSLLTSQVGFMDAIPLRGMYSEHVLSHDSHDPFSPDKDKTLVCTPEREFFFVVGVDGIDLETWQHKPGAQPTHYPACLVGGRNDKAIAEMMQAREFTRAGLRVEEVVALRMYTGAGWESCCCACVASCLN